MSDAKSDHYIIDKGLRTDNRELGHINVDLWAWSGVVSYRHFQFLQQVHAARCGAKPKSSRRAQAVNVPGLGRNPQARGQFVHSHTESREGNAVVWPGVGVHEFKHQASERSSRRTEKIHASSA
jgi:hypothetical protein